MNPGITKFENLPGIKVNKVVVLLKFERFFELCTIVPELMLGNKVAVEQQIDGIVKRSAAHAVFVVFHLDIERFYIKMPVGIINLLENCKTFRRFPMPQLFKIFCEYLFNCIKIYAFIFLRHTEEIFYKNTKLNIYLDLV